MTSATFDVVVVGGGHNGLVTAAYLARAGKRVAVLERNRYFGGGVATLEMTQPGFRHERHSAMHVTIMANPLIAKDELGLISRYGLAYAKPTTSFGAVFEDGDWIGLSPDRKATMASIAAVSPADAESYSRFADFAAEAMSALIPAFFAPPVSLGQTLAGMESTASGRQLARMTMQSAHDVICEAFENDKVRTAMLRLVNEILLIHPEEAGTGLFAVAGIGFVDGYGFCWPVGGGGRLTDALVRCIENDGGVLRTGVEVERITVENGRATGVVTAAGEQYRAIDAVLASIHPHHLDRHIDGLDPELVREAHSTKPSHYTAFVVHAPLERPLEFRRKEANDTALVVVGVTSLAEYLRDCDQLRRGQVSDHPLLWSTSFPDPARAPEGRGVLEVYCMTTYALADGGPAAWEERIESYRDTILGRLSQFTHRVPTMPGATPVVVSPLDHERDSPSFPGGDYNGVGLYLHQMLNYRPTPSLSDYTVPGVAGLYLVGPFMHPGGGVSGGGRATAVKMLTDLGLELPATS